MTNADQLMKKFDDHIKDIELEAQKMLFMAGYKLGKAGKSEKEAWELFLLITRYDR